jgi:hypothetical protein
MSWRRGTRGGIGVLAALLLLTAVAWAAKVTIQTASSGDVTATFSFHGLPPKVTRERLKIVRAGQQLYNQAVSSPDCGGSTCEPGATGSGASSVQVADIEADAAPDVILSLFSGGADCCFIDQVFRFDPGTMTYVKAEHNFGGGAILRRLAGRWRFVSTDAAFACAFTDCADSGQPIQIWSFAAGQFHKVTRTYRKLIGTDSAKWWRAFNHHISNGVGLIAAWAADQELLGHNHRVQSTLASEARKGRLRDDGLRLATGKRFVRRLNALLRKLGYEH